LSVTRNSIFALFKRHLIYRGCETKQKMIRGGKKVTIQILKKEEGKKILLTFSLI
jgi:hypothetical protein